MWIFAGVTRPARVRRPVPSKKRVFGIDFSQTGIGAVVMLLARQRLNRDFFTGMVPPSIFDDRALSPPKLKASGLFSIFTTHDLISLPTNMTHLGSQDYIILPSVRTWLRLIFGYSDILSIVLRDSSLTMTSHWKERCRTF
jgi:hypothetical protein